MTVDLRKLDPAGAVQPRMRTLQRRNPRNNGSAPRTTLLYAMHRVPSVRRNSSRPGLKMYKTGSGKMLSKSAIESTMPAVMPKSPRTVLLSPEGVLLQGELERPTQFWGNEKQRQVLLWKPKSVRGVWMELTTSFDNVGH